jgi:hypothetical protein|tara:strand:- start:147 stop:248 length:102 start_codon:yes stop_codon:yes gene_type:complete
MYINGVFFYLFYDTVEMGFVFFFFVEIDVFQAT